MFTPIHRAHAPRPSNFIVESVGPIAEWALDKVFISTIVIAPLAAVLAVFLLLRGELAWAFLSLLVALGAAIGVHARFVAPRQLQVTRLEGWQVGRFDQPSNLQTFKPLRVVFFSDLHLGEYKRREWAQCVVEAVNAQSPDLVLIGGDFVGRTKGCDVAELLAPLKQLRAPYGVYAVLGNHDYGIPGPDHSEDLFRILPEFNVRVLRNECVQIDEHMRLIGVDELWAEQADFDRACADCSCDDANGHAQVNAAKRTLVLGHNPDLMLTLDRSRKDHGAGLFIFGHTHQGQIYIPFLPGLAIPIKSKFYRGSYDTPHGPIYVSSGCGENTTPTRLNTRPEIVVFEL
jgi:hypothetical protein